VVAIACTPSAEAPAASLKTSSPADSRPTDLPALSSQSTPIVLSCDDAAHGVTPAPSGDAIVEGIVIPDFPASALDTVRDRPAVTVDGTSYYSAKAFLYVTSAAADVTRIAVADSVDALLFYTTASQWNQFGFPPRTTSGGSAAASREIALGRCPERDGPVGFNGVLLVSQPSCLILRITRSDTGRTAAARLPLGADCPPS